MNLLKDKTVAELVSLINGQNNTVAEEAWHELLRRKRLGKFGEGSEDLHHVDQIFRYCHNSDIRTWASVVYRSISSKLNQLAVAV